MVCGSDGVYRFVFEYLPKKGVGKVETGPLFWFLVYGFWGEGGEWSLFFFFKGGRKGGEFLFFGSVDLPFESGFEVHCFVKMVFLKLGNPPFKPMETCPGFGPSDPWLL